MVRSSKSKTKQIALFLAFSSLFMGLCIGVSAFSKTNDFTYEINFGTAFFTGEPATNLSEPEEETETTTSLSIADGSRGLNFFKSLLEQPVSTLAEDANTLTIEAITNQTYTGADLTPAVVVKDGNTTLTLNTHYTVAYTNNRNVGTATVTVTGAGTYTGAAQVTQTFTIVAKNASTLDIDPIANQIYTGTDLTPALVVKNSNTTLTLNTDYTVAYTNNINVGTATVTITGIGNYTGTATRTFTITKDASTLTIEAITNPTYTGADLTPAVVVKDGSTTLTLDTDYTVAYTNNRNVGTATVTITGIGTYTGTKTQTFTIVAKNVSTLIIETIANQAFTGAALTPAVVVKDGSTTLTETADYTVAYADNINLGTATVTITGAGNYTGTATQTFTILKNASTLTIEAITNQTYTGADLTPAVVVKDGNTTLTLGTDYTVAYTNNRNVGTATVTITGIGAYTGTATQTFTVVAKNASGLAIVAIDNQIYTGADLIPAVVVKDGSTTLTLGTHYTVAYTNNRNVGTATVTITGIGNYTGTATQTFTIVAKNASELTIEAIANQTYTGAALTPAVVVKDGSTTLTETTDYTVAYSANTNVGTATVTITGAGNYTGTKTQTFTITQNSTASISSNFSVVGEGQSIIISASINAVNTKEVLIYPTFSGTSGLGIDYTVAFASNGLELVAGGNGQGNNANQLNGPAPIVTFISEAEQAIYIADASSGRVIKWGFGAQTGQILINNQDVQNITDIYVDGNKNIYLVEQNASVVSRWNFPNYSQRQVIAGRLRENGSDANLLHAPHSFQVIEQNSQVVEIFISDTQNHRVQKWVVGQNQGTTVAGGNGSGSTANQLFEPRKIWVDEQSNVFVLDSRNSRIQKWTPNASQGETVYQGNQYSVINDFDRDGEGNWYLINRWPTINLTKFSSDFRKQYLLVDGSINSPFEFDNPTSITVDAFGDAYIGDSGNFRVLKYNNNPKFKIPAGQTTATITLTAIDNDQFDGDRSINLAIQGGRNIDFDPSQNLSISITENDTPDPVVTLSTSIQEVEEGDSFNLTATLNQASTRDAFINLSFGGTADLEEDFKLVFPTKGPRVVAGGNGAGSLLNQLGNPRAVTVGPDGAIYTADENSQLAKWMPGKTEKQILPYAVNLVRDIHVDRDNNLFVLDEATHRIIKFTPNSNNGTVVAGSQNGNRGSAANRFDTPLSLFVDDQGAMYVADHSNHRVQKWAPGATEGITVAGGNGEGSGPTQLRSPRAVTVGKDGAIYVSDANNQVSKWLPGRAEKEILPFNPNDFWDIHVDENDNLYLLERWTHTLVKYAKGSSERIILAGNSDASAGSSLDRLNDPSNFYLDKSNNIFIADRQNSRVIKYQVSPEIVIPKGQLTGSITLNTIDDDSYEGDETIELGIPGGLNIDYDGSARLTVALKENDTPDPVVSIRSSLTQLEEGGQFDITATLETVSSRDALISLSLLGSAAFDQDYTADFPTKGPSVVAGGNGDGNNLNQARRPRALAVGNDGSVYVSEEENWRLSRWYPGKAEKQVLNINTMGARAIHVDQEDNIYVLEEWGHKLVKYPAGSAVGTVIAGDPGNQSGDAMNRLNNAQGFFFAANGDIYIADQNNHRIQKWAQGATEGVTVAGGNGDGRASNQLSWPRAVTVDSKGMIYVSDNWGQITRWTPGKPERENLQFSTNGARGLYVDKADNLYILEERGHRLVKYAPGTTVGVVIAGDPAGQSGNSLTRFNNPQGLVFDAFGNIYIADQGNNRVVKYQMAPEILVRAGQLSGNITLKTIDDDSYEGDETIELGIRGGLNIVYTSSARQTVTIEENDTPDPVVSIGSSLTELEEGGQFDITATLETVSTRDALISLSFSGSSAFDQDYTVDFPTKGPSVAAGGNGEGEDLNQTRRPRAVAVGKDGSVYVSEEGNWRVSRWYPGKAEKQVLNINTMGARAIHVDQEDNIYVLEEWGHKLVKYPAGRTEGTVIAGDPNGQSGDAMNRLNNAQGFFFAANGDIYIVDHNNHRVQKWAQGATEGVTVAGGNGDGRASNQLSWPRAVTVDSKGMIYVSDNWGQITRWTPGKPERENLQISTNGARGLYVDKADNLYVLEEWGHKLVKYAPGTTVGVVIGGDAAGQSGNSLTRFNSPQGLVFDALGNVYIADHGNNRVVKYQLAPEILVRAGQLSGSISVTTIDDSSFEEDEAIEMQIIGGRSIDFDSTQKVTTTILDNDQAPEITLEISSDRIVEASTDLVFLTAKTNTVAGKDIEVFLSVSDESDAGAEKYEISSLRILIAAGDSTSSVNLKASDFDDDQVDILRNIILSVDSIRNGVSSTEKIEILYESNDDPSFDLAATVSEVAEHLSFDLTATLSAASSRDALIAFSFKGTTEFDTDYLVDFPTKGPRIVAGGNGDGDNLNQARRPRAVAVGKDGSVYVSEEGNWRVSRWYPGMAEKQVLNINTNGGRAIHVDQEDNIYVLEEWGHKLVKYPAGRTEGTVIAGDPNGQSGDAMNRLNNPQGFFIAANEDIYIVDHNNHRVQKWAKGATEGVTVAGGNGDGRASNQLSWPRAVTVDSKGMIYVSDNWGQITRWTPGKTEREILQIPTNGARGLYVDKADNLYVLEEWGQKLVKYAPGTTVGVVIAGDAASQSGNSLTRFNSPQGLGFDALGNVYIADHGNNRVVKYQFAPEVLIPAGSTSASIKINLIDDDINEPNETIKIVGDAFLNTFPVSQDTVSVTVLDNSKTLELKDAPFIGLSNGAVAWGDYDRDGDMDVAVMGISPTSGAVTRLYENVDGKFEDTNQNFARFFDGDISWVDLNKDGWIDLVISGLVNNKPETKVYMNKDGRFFEESVSYGLPKLFSSKLAWGDLDNDGDIDLAIAGIDESDKYVFEVYYKEDSEQKYTIEPDFLRNNNFNGFGESGFINGDLKIIDVDLDGDNDIVYSGTNKSGAPIGGIITNSYIRSGQFNLNQNFSNDENRLRLGLKNSALVIDKLSSQNITQLDIITMGEDSQGKLYFTSSAAFQSGPSNVSLGFSKLKNGSIALGDLNNDGLLDIIQSGEDDKGNPESKIFLQRKSSVANNFPTPSPVTVAPPLVFELWDIALIGLRESTINLVDYDMDGDLDLFLTGLDKEGLPRSILYESIIKNKSNAAPEKVSGLKFEDLGNGNVRFSWDVAQDDHSRSLGYNLRLGLTPGGDELSNVESDLSTGYRLISKPATIYRNSFETQLDPGIYYWSVQAVDDGLLGGEFSDESGFSLVYEWKILNQGGIVDRRIEGLDSPVIKLGDLDADGDLDLIYGSSKFGNLGVFKFDGKRMLRDNTSPIFVDRIVDAEVGDINGDGKLDILVNNFSFDGRFNFRIFLSQPNGQYKVREEESLFNAKGKIIDLNNDGKSEVVISGLSSSTSQGVPRLFVYEYQGDDAPFIRTDLSSQIAQLTSSSFDLGDFDNDQDIDYILTGFSVDGLRSYIYENTSALGGSFKLTQTENNIASVRNGTIDFVDFDGDGDLDIIVTGTGANGDLFEVYMNQLNEGKSSWSRINLGLTAIRNGNIDLGDFNGDGYADLLYSGIVQGQGKVTKLAEFDPINLSYRDSDFDVSDITDADVEFGDIDGDGDLDFIISGNKRGETAQFLLRAYINVRSESAKVLEKQAGLVAFNSFDPALTDPVLARLTDSPIDNFRLEAQTDFVVNNPPSIPQLADVTILTDLALPGNKKAIELVWNPSVDDHTPSKGLTYALRLGTSPNGEEIVASNAGQDGWRNAPGKGNAEHNLKWKLSLDPGTYYWSVQAIDASFAGSRFSQEGSFVVGAAGLNRAPLLETTELDLIEFSKVGFKVGTLKGTDPEGHSFKWGIFEGNQNNLFKIDSLSGDLFVANQMALDYRLYTSIELKVKITDELGAASINTLIIYLIEDGDSDGDGVKNNLDLCPGTIAGQAVDEFGCSSSQGTVQLKLKNISVLLGSTGEVQVKPTEVDNGSIHPLPNVSFQLRLSKTNFTCADLGTNLVEVISEDSRGKIVKGVVEIVVKDEIKPTLKVKSSYTIKLDATGNATLKWEDIDEGSTDNCSIKDRTLSKTTFTRANGGENKITYTISDSNGNSSAIELNVVVDIILSNPELVNSNAKVKAYPNPVDDYLTIEFEEGINYESILNTDLTDASGKVINKIILDDLGNSEVGFSTAQFNSGIYFLRIATRSKLYLIKFTVIH